MMSSNKLLAISFFISLSIFSSVTKAAEHLLANITTDVNSDSYQFVVDANADERALTSFYINHFTNGVLSKKDTLLMDNFINGGLNLPENTPHSFIKMNGRNFDRSLGGVIILDVLVNAVTGKRKSYELDLAQDSSAQGIWKLFYKGKTISRIRAVANRIPIVGVVGAKELQLE